MCLYPHCQYPSPSYGRLVYGPLQQLAVALPTFNLALLKSILGPTTRVII